jgi:hypothetical protein
LNPWFFTGLAEGAASFTFSRSGRQIAVYFAVKSPDERLLASVQRFLDGAGKIYLAGNNRMYRVTRREELQRVVAHFDAFPLQGDKLENYGLWREMVGLKQAFRQATNRQALEDLATRLSSRSVSS